MNFPEKKAMLKLALGLFPEMTAEHLKLLGEKIDRLDKITVETTLKNHKLGHEFFSFPGFMEGARAEYARSQARVAKSIDEKTVDWLLKDPQYQGMKPAEAVIAHFKAAWAATKNGSADENLKQIIRRMIRGHCRKALLELKWKASEVNEVADECVGLEPGQKIITERIKMFRDVPEAMVTQMPADAIKQLQAAT